MKNIKTKEWCTADDKLFHSSHQSTLLAGLHSLRERGLLLDITLFVGGECFNAHKAVLSACSDYFRAMFTEPMLEARQNEVTLNGLTAQGFQVLLDYAYTARLGLDQTNVQDVLSAATHVQMLSVVHACSTYLQSQIDIENCVDITNIAENYSLSHLKTHVYKYMSSHLVEFSNSHEFYRLSPQQLEALLLCDYPVNCSETDILKIVVRWWFSHVDNAKEKLPVDYTNRILRAIRFTEIPRYKMGDVLENNFWERGFDLPLYKLVLNEYDRQQGCKIFKICRNNLLNTRGMEKAMLKIGGFGIAGMTNEITYCLTNERKWRHLTSVPHVEQCNFGAAVLNNELYVVGGCFDQSLQENIHPFGFKYNPCYNEWSTMAPMMTERCRFSLNVVGGNLYAVGGSIETENVEGGNDSTSSGEIYDPATDTWENIAPMRECRTQHAGAVYEDGTDPVLFISGGLDKDGVVTASMTCYDTLRDVWQSCPPMITPRADHTMVCVGHKLYVCAGWMEEPETRNRMVVDTIDAYDIVRNVWQVVTQIPNPRYHSGIVALDNKIYFIGGFHTDAIFDRDNAAIACYDIQSRTWSTEDKYPQVTWEHCCATLYVPKCRDDMEVLDFV